MEDKSAVFPVKFPVSRELQRESGSLETASSTNQAGLPTTVGLHFAGHLSFMEGIKRLEVATSAVHRQNLDISEISIRILTEAL
jgi:hypothetical protein